MEPKGGGHIGQFIAKEYRNKGYATRGLALTLKVMLKNDGYIVREDDVHYYVRIKNK